MRLRRYRSSEPRYEGYGTETTRKPHSDYEEARAVHRFHTQLQQDQRSFSRRGRHAALFPRHGSVGPSNDSNPGAEGIDQQSSRAAPFHSRAGSERSDSPTRMNRRAQRSERRKLDIDSTRFEWLITSARTCRALLSRSQVMQALGPSVQIDLRLLNVLQ